MSTCSPTSSASTAAAGCSTTSSWRAASSSCCARLIRMTTRADPPRSADVLLRGGAVYRVNAARGWAQAVAVTGDRILAVGSDAELRELVTSATRVIDLRGRMLLPGFQDAHVHASGGGL